MSTELLIRRLPFQRLVRDHTREKTQLKISGHSIKSSTGNRESIPCRIVRTGKLVQGTRETCDCDAQGYTIG